jgi:hypothetical protein
MMVAGRRQGLGENIDNALNRLPRGEVEGNEVNGIVEIENTIFDCHVDTSRSEDKSLLNGVFGVGIVVNMYAFVFFIYKDVVAKAINLARIVQFPVGFEIEDRFFEIFSIHKYGLILIVVVTRCSIQGKEHDRHK